MIEHSRRPWDPAAVDPAELTADDRDSVARAEATLRRGGWSSGLSLDGALATWGRFAREVADGYRSSVEAYTHELTVRDWINAAWPLLSPGVRAVREPELSLPDEQFRRATEEDDGALLGRFFHVTDSPWWWHRRPLVLVGEFAEDVRRTGC
jgi:hypothetical protein